MSKATLREGKITQVSRPPIESPSTGYPSTSKHSFFFVFPECAAMDDSLKMKSEDAKDK